MTVNTDTASQAYTGNGSTAIFAVPFYFLVDTDLKVSKLTAAGVSSVLVLNSDYTVSGAGNEVGGSITTVPALPTGDKIFIERSVDAVQQTEYPTNGPFPAASHERALDRLTMLIQQCLSKLGFGLFRDPLGSTYDLGSNTLINSGTAVNANDVPNLLQTQTLVTSAASGLDPSLIATYPALAGSSTASQLGFLPSGTGAVGTTIERKLRERVSVFDFMTSAQVADVQAGTQTQDVTAAIQNAITRSYNKEVFFPPGSYKITAPLVIAGPITLKCTRSSVRLVAYTQDQDHIQVGDGTLTTRDASLNVIIDGFTFIPATGLNAFATGSAIFLNYTAWQTIQNCDIYGKDSAGNVRLYNGITVRQTQTFYIKKCQIRYTVNAGTYMTGATAVALRTVDGYLDELEYTSCGGDCVYLGQGCAGLVINRITGQTFSTWGIHVNTNPVGGSGQNIFIVQPDLECDGTSSGIWLEYAQRVQIIGGWIGLATQNTSTGILFDTNSSLCAANGVALSAAGIVINGNNNSVLNCEISGDNSTSATGISVTAQAVSTQIVGCRIAQWTTAGITFTGNPAKCVVTGVHFRQCVAEITGQAYSGALIPPVISGCQTDAAYAVTAAASITLHAGRNMYQVTGATSITTLTALGQGSHVSIQSGTGGITLATGGNIHAKSMPVTVTAFSVITFVCDGTDWFEVGRNF